PMSVSSVGVNLEALATRHALDTTWVSALQQQMTRWRTVALGPWQPVRPAGSATELTSVMQRGVSVQAPLQSLLHFPLGEQDVWAWHQLSITLHPQASTDTPH